MKVIHESLSHTNNTILKKKTKLLSKAGTPIKIMKSLTFNANSYKNKIFLEIYYHMGAKKKTVHFKKQLKTAFI